MAGEREGKGIGTADGTSSFRFRLSCSFFTLRFDARSARTHCVNKPVARTVARLSGARALCLVSAGRERKAAQQRKPSGSRASIDHGRARRQCTARGARPLRRSGCQSSRGADRTQSGHAHACRRRRRAKVCDGAEQRSAGPSGIIIQKCTYLARIVRS